jgi:transposase
MDATTIGVDLAKRVFELALANAHWRVMARKRLTRTQFERFLAAHPSAHVVMEACGTAHDWARRARDLGRRVSLLPAQYVYRRRLGAISKQGDVYLRCLLTHGARAVRLAAHRAEAKRHELTRLHQWALEVRQRRGHNKATIAVATKLARIVWAVWSRDEGSVDRPALTAAA